MTPTNNIKTTKSALGTVKGVLRAVEKALEAGTATEIVIQDDRGGTGYINVYVTTPR